MNRFPFPNAKKWRVFFALYLFLLVYFTRDSQAGLYLLGFTKAQILSFAVTGLTGIVFLFFNRKHLSAILCNGRIPLALLFSLTVLVPMIWKRDWQLMYISMVYCILAAVLISYFASLEQTARAYVLLFSFLGAYSLLCTYILRIPADRGILVPPVFENSFQARFYNYLLCFVSVTYAKSRNFGIFREPGVYQFFLFLALYLNNYQASWKREATMWLLNGILALTMFSTFSTAGVAVTVVFLLVLLFEKKVFSAPLGRKLGILAAAALLVLAGYLVIARPPLYTQLQLMIEKLFTSNNSLNDRVDCILFNLYVIQWHPLKGRTLAYVLETVTHNTSSSTILFAVLGIFFGWLNLFGWVTLVFRGRGSVPAKLISLAALAVAFNSENLITNPIFWLFPILCLTEGLLPLFGRKPQEGA